MRRWLLCCSVVLALMACSEKGPNHVAEFWRPISEPNVQMPSDKVQKKLEFDFSQCHCGIYPANSTRSNLVEFQPDVQRLAETGVVVTPNDRNECVAQPSLIVSECMRQRGWEVTNCSGRMPLPGGGSLCSAYTFPDQ